MRMERNTGEEDVCVLVRGDGKFHVERLFINKTDIFEGTIAQAELQQLERNLNSDQLFHLTQEQIEKTLIIKGTDALILSVARPGYWQNLQFPDSEARTPFHQSLDPLVKWLDIFKKQGHSSLSEDSARNNCLPPENIQLRVRPEAAGIASSPQPLTTSQPTLAHSLSEVRTPFLMRMLSYRVKPIARTREVEHDCLIVYVDGRYHRERQWQRSTESHPQSTIIEGSVQNDGLQQLRQVLDDAKLQQMGEKDPPYKMPVQEMEYTSLVIPRADREQKANFWKYFAAFRTGSAGIPLIDDNNSKRIKPLKEWIKSNIEENGRTLGADNVPDCALSQNP
jgi:hypothetical protein